MKRIKVQLNKALFVAVFAPFLAASLFLSSAVPVYAQENQPTLSTPSADELLRDALMQVIELLVMQVNLLRDQLSLMQSQPVTPPSTPVVDIPLTSGQIVYWCDLGAVTASSSADQLVANLTWGSNSDGPVRITSNTGYSRTVSGNESYYLSGVKYEISPRGGILNSLAVKQGGLPTVFKVEYPTVSCEYSLTI